ncbi:MAG: hypothetical protein P8Z37_05730 [Acidobacteriota bacterium]
MVLLFWSHKSVWTMQSLADAARTEAERRKSLGQSEIEETIIEGNGACYSGKGNVSSFKSAATEQKKLITVVPSKDRSALRRYRTRLQKIVGNIAKIETRLQNLKDRLRELKRKNLLIKDLSGLALNEESQDKTSEQIEEVIGHIKLQKRERSDVYDEGRREGFLPGELEGEGIIP